MIQHSEKNSEKIFELIIIVKGRELWQLEILEN